MKSKKIIILLSVLLLILFCFTGCNSNKNNDDSSNSQINQENQKSKNSSEGKKQEKLNNIEMESAELKDRSILIKLKNNNDKDIKSLIIKTLFYDENNEVVGTAETSFRVIKSKAEVAVCAVESYDVPQNYSTYEIKLDIDSSYIENENGYADKIKITSKDTGEKIMVTATNESDVKLNKLAIGVVFYNEGIPVGYSDETQYEVEPNDTEYYNIIYPYDKNYDTIKFDEFKIFVNSAYETF